MAKTLNKKLSRLTLRQLNEFYAHYHGEKLARDELETAFKEEKAKIKTICGIMPLWAPLYELAFEQIIALIFILFAHEDTLYEISHSNDPLQALLDFLNSGPQQKIDDGDIENEEDLERISVYLSLHFSTQSIERYGKPISEMLANFRETNNDDILLSLITLDRAIVANTTVARRITFAQLTQDNSFMGKLSKAITQTKPSRPKAKYDDLRFMAKIIDQTIDLKTVTFAQLYKILAEDMELYPTDTKDSLAGFKWIIKGLGIK